MPTATLPSIPSPTALRAQVTEAAVNHRYWSRQAELRSHPAAIANAAASAAEWKAIHAERLAKLEEAACPFDSCP